MIAKKRKKINTKIAICIIMSILIIVAAIVIILSNTNHKKFGLNVGDKVSVQVGKNINNYVFTTIDDSHEDDKTALLILDGYYKDSNGERWFLGDEADKIIKTLGWENPKLIRMLTAEEAKKLGCGDWGDKCEWLSEDLTYPGTEHTGFYNYAFWTSTFNSIGMRYEVTEQGFLELEDDEEEYRGIRPVIEISKDFVEPIK